MRISLGHLPFIAVEIDPETEKTAIWADSENLDEAVVARMVIALRAIADAWEARLTSLGKQIADPAPVSEIRNPKPFSDIQQHGNIVNLTVAWAGAPSLASQCSEGHPLWEGVRSNSVAEVRESLRVHNYVAHNV